MVQHVTAYTLPEENAAFILERAISVFMTYNIVKSFHCTAENKITWLKKN